VKGATGFSNNKPQNKAQSVIRSLHNNFPLAIFAGSGSDDYSLALHFPENRLYAK